MALNVVIKVGKKHLASFDRKLFEMKLRAELARDLDLHISTQVMSFTDNPSSTVIVNNHSDNEEAKTILKVVNLTYFHLAADASSAMSVIRNQSFKEEKT